jgi:hypothetical protein
MNLAGWVEKWGRAAGERTSFTAKMSGMLLAGRKHQTGFRGPLSAALRVFG